jgi:hypothetical protein
MKSIDIANQYFAAWNARDSHALVSVFAEGGTYCDPTTPGRLTGPATPAMPGRCGARFRIYRSRS